MFIELLLKAAFAIAVLMLTAKVLEFIIRAIWSRKSKGSTVKRTDT